MKIDRPDWLTMTQSPDEHWRLGQLDKWFNENVKPLNDKIEKAIRVYGPDPTTIVFCRDQVEELDRYSGLVIDYGPMKKETAEDVLRDYLKTELKSIAHYGEYSERSPFPEIIKRAKAVLSDA